MCNHTRVVYDFMIFVLPWQALNNIDNSVLIKLDIKIPIQLPYLLAGFVRLLKYA